MSYYTSETCGYSVGYYVDTGCKPDYTQSDIKYAIDAWKIAEAPSAIEARLITYDELIDNLGYDPTISSTENPQVNENVPSWLYDSNYDYWTMTQYPNSSSAVRYVDRNGNLDNRTMGNYNYYYVVRPVITISKSAIFA